MNKVARSFLTGRARLLGEAFSADRNLQHALIILGGDLLQGEDLLVLSIRKAPPKTPEFQPSRPRARCDRATLTAPHLGMDGSKRFVSLAHASGFICTVPALRAC